MTVYKKSLQQIFLESDSSSTAHSIRLDKISTDLKLLIKKLSNLQIPFTYIYILSCNELRRNIRFAEFEEVCLTWGKDPNGKFQLRYNIYRISIELGEDGYRKKGSPERMFHIDSKPVFELKAHLRIQLEDELVPFYQKLKELLKQTNYDACEIVLSPNHFDPMEFHISHIIDHHIQTFK